MSARRLAVVLPVVCPSVSHPTTPPSSSLFITLTICTLFPIGRSGAIGSPAMFNARARDAKWVFLGTGQATRLSNGDAARAGAVLGLVFPRGLRGGGSLPMRIRLS